MGTPKQAKIVIVFMTVVILINLFLIGVSLHRNQYIATPFMLGNVYLAGRTVLHLRKWLKEQREK